MVPPWELVFTLYDVKQTQKDSVSSIERLYQKEDQEKALSAEKVHS